MTKMISAQWGQDFAQHKVCKTDHKTPQLQPLPDLQLQSQVGKTKQSENPEVANKSMYLVNNAKQRK